MARLNGRVDRAQPIPLVHKVRRAAADDVDGLLPLYSEFHRDLAALVPTAEDLRQSLEWLLTRNHVRIYVARAGARILGFSVLRFLPAPGRAHLDDLYVRAAARGRGCGRRLVERAVSDARECGCLSIALETTATNAASNALYRSLGFTGARRAEVGDHRIRYHLSLSSPAASPTPSGKA